MREEFSTDIMHFGIALDHTFQTFKKVYKKNKITSIEDIFAIFKKKSKPLTLNLIKTKELI